MKDMCAACGGDLRKLHAETDTTNGFGPKKTLADLPMHANVQAVHSLPELRISESEAQRAAHEEIQRLHDNRKLVLLVDLDQTVIHTTQNRPKKLTKNTISFQLTRQDPWLWTRLR
jgi:RNA polymerase II subunit A C-terminal domain phosphatase